LSLPHLKQRARLKGTLELSKDAWSPSWPTPRSKLGPKPMRFCKWKSNAKIAKNCAPQARSLLEVWEQQILARTVRLRPAPAASLLDLHFSLRTSRRVLLRHIIQFDGLDFEISPTDRKSVTVLFHTGKQFWVAESTPHTTWPSLLVHFSL